MGLCCVLYLDVFGYIWSILCVILISCLSDKHYYMIDKQCQFQIKKKREIGIWSDKDFMKVSYDIPISSDVEKNLPTYNMIL